MGEREKVDMKLISNERENVLEREEIEGEELLKGGLMITVETW